MATHAGAWQTDLYGQRRKYYHRYCIWEGCCDTDTHKRKPTLDDAAHVLLKCPLHRVDRAVMLRTAQAALLRAGLTLADVGSDTAMVQLLLGSMPITAAAALRENTAVHRDVLRASSKYIKCVHDARWTYGHMWNE